MPYINYREKEVSFKIVYYGPGLSGKTTNLMYIYNVLDTSRKGEIITLDTAQERTLFFDFFPLDLGRIGGYAVRFNMYTVPGQTYYEASRRLILEGADGVVFVADSHRSKLDENLESLRAMRVNLSSFGIDADSFPLILQYNKRYVEDPLPLGKLEAELCLNGVTVMESVAVKGTGVLETIRALSRMVIEKFNF
jgi:signal recognition particle receptor subunit beta